MYQTERMEEILNILRKYHYVTVNFLVEQIRYSPASIRRDLTVLEKRGLVKRSYGGVELKAEGSTPFVFRQHSMKKIKNNIASKAAKLVNDNDTVFVDGSSSAQYLCHYLEEKKGITVITNNMTLATALGEKGISVYCTGGYISESPGILSGELTMDAFASFHADIAFFSTGGYADGVIYENGEIYCKAHRIMIENADKTVFLCGSDKLGRKLKKIVCNLESIDYFITDGEINNEDIKKYNTTKFISTSK